MVVERGEGGGRVVEGGDNKTKGNEKKKKKGGVRNWLELIEFFETIVLVEKNLGFFVFDNFFYN